MNNLSWLNPDSSSGNKGSGLDFNDSKGLRDIPKASAPAPTSSAPTQSAYKPVESRPPENNRPPQQQQQQQQQTQTRDQEQPRNENEPKYKKAIRYLIIFLDLFFSILISAAAAMGMSTAKSISDSSLVFQGLYLIFFSAILFVHECMQICRLKMVDMIIRKNCGFLYGPFGKGGYLIFIAILTVGLSSNTSLGLPASILVGIWGVIVIAISFVFPTYFDKQDKVPV